MKVAYINTVFGVKSTGRTYAELKDYLEKSGNDCKFFYGVGKASEPGTYLIGSRFTYYFHNLMSRITGLEGYFSYFATQRLVKQLKEYDPDIIHLGSVHGHYINLRVLYKYLSGVTKACIHDYTRLLEFYGEVYTIHFYGMRKMEDAVS